MAAATTLARQADLDRGREQLLVFCHDAAAYAVVDQVIGELMLPNVSIRKGGVEDAIRFLGDHPSPRLLLIDLSGAAAPVADVSRLADVCEPGVIVLAIGERNDCGLFRELLSQGVADYLVKPVAPELLRQALLQATEQAGEGRSSGRLGKLVAVTGARGGVGATTVATSIAWLLAKERHRRVALVDLDLQFGTVALALDLEPSHGLREALEDPARIDSLFVDRVLVQHSDHLFVLSAEEQPEDALAIDPAALDLLLAELRAKFHYVIVDLPRGGGAAGRQVLQDASHLVLVSDASLAGLRDSLRITGGLPALNASCATMIVANRVGEHKQGEMARGEFEKGLGRKLDLSLPFDGRTIAAATNLGRPVAATGSGVAKGLRTIVDGLCGAPSRPAGRGLLRRWLGRA